MGRAGAGLGWALMGTWTVQAAPQLGIAPTITIFPDPPCAGDSITIEVNGMPDEGKWKVLVRYSKGGADAPHEVDDSGSTATQSNVPSAAGGGVMNVTVDMGGSSHTQSFPVRECP